ncbi:MAG TPA: hypothetical protein VGH15_05780 [Caulobacteraceae bacterium]|jgi:hypothetical protein
MTVGELIERLTAFPRDREVFAFAPAPLRIHAEAVDVIELGSHPFFGPRYSPSGATSPGLVIEPQS